MSQALCCLGLKTGTENCTLKINVKLSKRHDIWALSLSEIKRMKCDTSSPLFQFKKSFKSYWVLIQRPNQIWHPRVGTIYTNTLLRVGFLWMTPLGVQNLMVCVTPFRANLEVWHGWVALMCERVIYSALYTTLSLYGLFQRLDPSPSPVLASMI